MRDINVAQTLPKNVLKYKQKQSYSQTKQFEHYTYCNREVHLDNNYYYVNDLLMCLIHSLMMLDPVLIITFALLLFPLYITVRAGNRRIHVAKYESFLE